MIVSSSLGAEFAAELAGEPIHNDPGSTTVFSGISVPAAMIDPAPIFAPFRMIEPMPIRQRSSTDASVQRDRVAHGDVLADINAPLLLHAVKHTVVLNVRVGADANLVDVTAEDCIHPHRGVLAENDVTDNLRGVVDEAGGRDRRADTFEGSDHCITAGRNRRPEKEIQHTMISGRDAVVTHEILRSA